MLTSQSTLYIVQEYVLLQFNFTYEFFLMTQVQKRMANRLSVAQK